MTRYYPAESEFVSFVDATGADVYMWHVFAADSNCAASGPMTHAAAVATARRRNRYQRKIERRAARVSS